MGWLKKIFGKDGGDQNALSSDNEIADVRQGGASAKIALPFLVDDKYLTPEFATQPKKPDQSAGFEVFKKAIPLFNADKFADAAPLLEEALSLGMEPETTGVTYHTLGKIAVAQGDIPKAVEYFLACLEQPANVDTTVFQAASHLKIVFGAAGHVRGAEEFGELANKANSKGLSLSGDFEQRLLALAAEQMTV